MAGFAASLALSDEDAEDGEEAAVAEEAAEVALGAEQGEEEAAEEAVGFSDEAEDVEAAAEALAVEAPTEVPLGIAEDARAEEGEEAIEGEEALEDGEEEAEVDEQTEDGKDSGEHHEGTCDADEIGEAMLHVAGLGGEVDSALIEFRGCRMLLGCPKGVCQDLKALGMAAANVDAVLLTSGESADGLPELLAEAGPGPAPAGAWAGASDGAGAGLPAGAQRQPRLLGTTPVLLAVEARLQDLGEHAKLEEAWAHGGGHHVGRRRPPPAPAAAEARAAAFEAARVALDAAEGVSFAEEVIIEGPQGPVVAVAASSGYGLGGCYWLLEVMGARVAALGPCSLSVGLAARPFDPAPLRYAAALVLPSGACAAAPPLEPPEAAVDAIHAVAAEAADAVQAGGVVLLPLDASCALAVDVAEAVGKALAALPQEAQAPVFAVGGPARVLRRCPTFAEWAQHDRLKAAYEGGQPFLVEALQRSSRLVLDESAHVLVGSGAYREPCVALLPAEILGNEADGTIEVGRPKLPAHCEVLLGLSPANSSSAAAPTVVAGTSSAASAVVGTAPRILLEAAAASAAAPIAAPAALAGPGPPAPRRRRCSRLLELRPTAGALAELLGDTDTLEVAIAAPSLDWPLQVPALQQGAAMPAPRPPLALRRARRTALPLDVARPRALHWLSAEDASQLRPRLKAPAVEGAAALAARGGQRRRVRDASWGDIALCCMEGVFIEHKRPRVTAECAKPSPPLFMGEVDRRSFEAALATRGHLCGPAPGVPRPVPGEADAREACVEVPSLEARVWLNQCAPGLGGIETIVEAPTASARQMLAEVLEELMERL